MSASVVDEIIASLPSGLDRAVLRILDFHKGREHAIGRADLVRDLAGMGYRVSERAAREQISLLRKAGSLICSAPGRDGGYWLAASREEYEDFKHQEYLAKINDMRETLAAMDQAAERTWGKYSPAKQPSLFG
ncbi:MAG TPA: hypothetical protein PKD55_10755 [Bellilinea sp.]|nr:hypothetical protein [Bellilinea sp.]